MTAFYRLPLAAFFFRPAAAPQVPQVIVGNRRSYQPYLGGNNGLIAEQLWAVDPGTLERTPLLGATVTAYYAASDTSTTPLEPMGRVTLAGATTGLYAAPTLGATVTDTLAPYEGSEVFEVVESAWGYRSVKRWTVVAARPAVDAMR